MVLVRIPQAGSSGSGPNTSSRFKQDVEWLQVAAVDQLLRLLHGRELVQPVPDAVRSSLCGRQSGNVSNCRSRGHACNTLCGWWDTALLRPLCCGRSAEAMVQPVGSEAQAAAPLAALGVLWWAAWSHHLTL